MKANLLVLQGGGPSPVLNATLAAVIHEAAAHPAAVGSVFGARFGVAGLRQGELVDLSALSRSEFELLRRSPGAALGSSRARIAEPEFEQLLALTRRHDVRYLLFCGGNGTMQGALLAQTFFSASGSPVQVIGAPKTVDNDIAGTDRCPGYASAARYVAQSTRDLGMDLRGLPQPISIFETMGRGAGWLAAAAAAAKIAPEDAPHLICLPEQPFLLDRFLSRLDDRVRRQGWAVAVVSEGIRDANGALVYETEDPAQADALRRPLTGGIGQHLAELVARTLKLRCRSEKPGLLGRSSMLHVSPQDLADAESVGRAAVDAFLAGESGKMVSLRPLGQSGHASACELLPLEAIAGRERTLPTEWLQDADIPPTQDFLRYLRPLIGEIAAYHAPFAPLPHLAGAR